MTSIGPVRSVKEYMQEVWKAPSTAGTAKLIYRGQEEDWDLLPKLFRDEDRDPTEIEELEAKLLAEFKSRSPYLLPSTPRDESDWWSLAQHHGLPTRLLDWSANPLIGLFFAVEKPIALKPTVWIYQATQKQLDVGAKLKSPKGRPRQIELTTVLEPRRHSQRVASQAGWHTIHRLHGDGKNLRVLPMNKMEFHKRRLSLVAVDPASAKAIRSELKNIGIHHATVYADLTSVCREIQDDLEIPSSMRRQRVDWPDRQRAVELHILALLLVNGKSLKVGDHYTWMYEPYENGNSSGGSHRLSEQQLKDARALAARYDPALGAKDRR